MLRYLILAGMLLSGCGLLEPRRAPNPEPVNVRFRVPEQPPPPIRPPARPGFYAFDQQQQAVIDFLNNLSSDVERNDYAFGSGCHRFNAGEPLGEVKRGFDKGLNHLSTEIDPIPSIPIGSVGCIFAYKPDQDYGISDDEYRKLEDRTAFQPFRVTDPSDPDYGNLVNISTRGRTIQALTGKLRALMSADDIILAATEADEITDYGCDTYCDIIEQPINRVDFLAANGIDIQRQFDDREATFSGVNSSGVALGSRLVLNLLSDTGRARYSEDTSNVQPDNININPFVIEAAAALRDGDIQRVLRSERIFQPVAREAIGPLLNGCIWGRIEDAATGNALSEVPTNVASSDRHLRLGIDSAIRPGMCFDCHENNVQEWNGAVLYQHVSTTPLFDSDEKEIAGDFMDPTRINQYQRRAQESYANRCLRPLDISPNDRDPINHGLLNPMRDNVTVTEASSRVDLTETEYLNCLRSSQVGPALLGSHLSGATVSFVDWAEAYPFVIDECNLQED